MHCAIVIPARFASTRLPGKPLLRETGKYLIQHVYERASLAQCSDEVIVATDDPRIEAAVLGFGGKAAMTRCDHASGTDRIAEVCQRLDAGIVINVQGDEPTIDPASIDLLADLLAANPLAPMATLAVPIRSIEQWRNPNCVKVVVDRQGQALYFSRSPIPFVRDVAPNLSQEPSQFLQHLGLYAYRRDFLLELATMRPEPLEQLEKLEQLRVLALGHPIQVGIVRATSVGIDTPEDYAEFVEAYRRGQYRTAA